MNNTDLQYPKKRKFKRTKGKMYCSNCGKYGHPYKNCNDPITSFGIINFLISTDDDNLIDTIIKELSIDTDRDIDFERGIILAESPGIKFENPHDIKLFGIYKNNIKFLMIRRKHTLGYIEFIRGRYSVENVDGIIFLFRQMTSEEIKRIGNCTFDDLWNNLWITNKNRMNYQNEFMASKNKFMKLKNIKDENYLNLEFYVNNVKPTWDQAEWGFPKGRRNYHESDITCAIREFQEESGFTDGEYIILDKLMPIDESLIGTNGKYYKHTYYPTISTTDRLPAISSKNKEQIDEIGDIGWFSYDDAMKLIRPHHTDRRKILTQLYMYIINVILDISKKSDIHYGNI